MADLITSARAKFNINQSSFTSAEDDTIAALVTAVSKAIKKYCKREFDSQSFDELYNGSGDERLILKQYPILSVARVATNPVPVLRVRNTSASNQRATVAVTATGLTLVHVASGVVTTDTSVTFAGNVTLNAVATAVNALGSGWEAEAVSGFTLRPSADLRAVQGALHACNQWAEIKLHVEELSDYEVDAARGWLYRSARFDGNDNYRIVYTAGHATVPEDVQEAAAQWVASLFWQTKDNPAVFPGLPGASIALLLAPHVRYRI